MTCVNLESCNESTILPPAAKISSWTDCHSAESELAECRAFYAESPEEMSSWWTKAAGLWGKAGEPQFSALAKYRARLSHADWALQTGTELEGAKLFVESARASHAEVDGADGRHRVRVEQRRRVALMKAASSSEQPQRTRGAGAVERATSRSKVEQEV